MNKQTIQRGCDYCGEARPVKRAKKKLAGSKQWQQLFLCSDCMEVKI